MKTTKEERDNLEYMIGDTFKKLPPSIEAYQSLLEKVIVPVLRDIEELEAKLEIAKEALEFISMGINNDDQCDKQDMADWADDALKELEDK